MIFHTKQGGTVGIYNSTLTLDENLNIFIRGGRFLISKTRIIPLAYVVILKIIFVNKGEGL